MPTINDLKNKVYRNRHLIAGAIGVTAVAAAVTTVVVVTIKALNAPMPSVTGMLMNDAESIDLSSLEQITKLHEMIDNCVAADVISLSEGAILFLEK